MRILKNILILIYLCIITSCFEDNSTNPSTTNWSEYFMFEKGNYWNFDDYLFNEAGEEFYVGGNKRLEIADKDVYLGRKCVKSVSYSSTQSPFHYCYRYVEGSKFYSSGHHYSIDMGLEPYCPWDEECWVLVADLEAQSWECYRNDNINKTFDDGVTFKGKIRIWGEMGKDTNINLKGKDYPCITMINHCDIEGVYSLNGNEYDIGHPYRITIYMYSSK